MKKISVVLAMLALVLPWAVPVASARTPNDPYYNQQWYLRQIGMRDAWDVSIGSPDVVVAVIDTGVDIYHEDLEANIWSNSGEIPGNNRDDDGNGYIDDIHGWNFVVGSNDVRPWGDATSEDALVHGTLVASIIGATGDNGKGIAGIVWNVKIMSLVALGKDGSGNTIDVANAVLYAVEKGADIINLSVEGVVEDAYFDEALAYARSRGVLTVTAAGNGQPDGRNLNITPVYPACSSLDGIYGVITAGGTNRFDQKSSYANYGDCVDVSAPSQDIFGARPLERGANGEIIAPAYDGGYSGTSLAAPIVSGLAALLKSRHPEWGASDLRNRIISGTVSIDDVNSLSYQGQLGSGRVDAALMLDDAYFLEQGKEPLELWGTNPGVPTRILIISDRDIIEVAPFGPEDTRGARAMFTDLTGDGVPEIAIVPASGIIAEWVLLGRDGQTLSWGELPGLLTDGALVAGVNNGFMIADAEGGQAWGLDADLIARAFYPYGMQYDLGLDLLEIDGAAAFAPRMSGGRLVITDVMGTQLVSAFPFGVDVSGRWAVAKTNTDGMTNLIFSGTEGTKRLDSKHLGQTGWLDVPFSELQDAPLTLSSGMATDDVSYRLYDEWPE